MRLRVGTIVKVTNQARSHCGHEGQVVGFDHHNAHRYVRVWFGREMDHMVDDKQRLGVDTHSVHPPPPGTQEQNPRTWSFAPEELEVIAEWSVGVLAERLFGNTFIRVLQPDAPFDPRTREQCIVCNCTKRAVRRIAVNVFNVVEPADVCEEHAREYHGTIREIFPRKQAAEAVVTE